MRFYILSPFHEYYCFDGRGILYVTRDKEKATLFDDQTTPSVYTILDYIKNYCEYDNAMMMSVDDDLILSIINS